MNQVSYKSIAMVGSLTKSARHRSTQAGTIQNAARSSCKTNDLIP